MRILAIAMLPPPIGGVSILTSITLSILTKLVDVDILEEKNINMKYLINEDFRQYDRVIFMSGNILKFLRFKWLVFILLLRLKKVNLSVRGYAGGLRFQLSKLRRIKLMFLSFFVDSISFETLNDTAYFRGLSLMCDVFWIPNFRPRRIKAGKGKGVVYIGRINPQKGVEYMNQYATNANLSIDCYGPLEMDLSNFPALKYRGLLKNELVPEIMSKYDSVILYTDWPTEGYPGVLLEAGSLKRKILVNHHNDLQEILSFYQADSKVVNIAEVKGDFPSPLFDSDLYANCLLSLLV